MHRILLLLLITLTARAELKLPAIFSDHMVLQQDRQAPVWGWAAPGESITVSIAGERFTTTADEQGAWRLVLSPLTAGETYQMTVSDTRTSFTIEDVLVGEVWLCAGQSNMEASVGGALAPEPPLPAVDTSRIRLFRVEHQSAAEPVRDVQGEWVVAERGAIRRFSAVAWFFGRLLHDRLDQPIGLIDSSWGGTRIEAWTSLQALAEDPELGDVARGLLAKVDKPWDQAAVEANHARRLAAWEAAVTEAKAAGEKPPRQPELSVAPRLDKNVPGNLFHGMIQPLIPYALRGAIWYQGESNAFVPFADAYGDQLVAMVADWRQRWGQAFPFAWVQLPEWRTRSAEQAHNWSVIREEMLKALDAIPNAGMAVTLGLGDAEDIHPKNKYGVGERLASWALAEVYGREMAWQAPLPADIQLQGDQATITFRHADGLRARGEAVTGFELAGRDQQWEPAQATIMGNRVTVRSARIAEPVAVRYAWADNPDWSLVNAAGLPATPFRSDDWAGPSATVERTGNQAIRLPAAAQPGPQLDGRLDEPAWQAARAYPLRRLDGGQPEVGSSVRFCWQGDELWLGITCTEPAMDQRVIGTTVDDDNAIWAGDFIEVLLEPAGYSYYQVTLNPAAAMVDLDQRIGLFYVWASGAEAAAQTGEASWTLEVRLPLAGEATRLHGIRGERPSEAAPWYVNICRYRAASEEVTALAGESRGFHDRSAFVRLVVE